MKPCKRGKLKGNGSYKGNEAKFGPTETFSYIVTKPKFKKKVVKRLIWEHKSNSEFFTGRKVTRRPAEEMMIYKEKFKRTNSCLKVETNYFHLSCITIYIHPHHLFHIYTFEQKLRVEMGSPFFKCPAVTGSSCPDGARMIMLFPDSCSIDSCLSPECTC